MDAGDRDGLAVGPGGVPGDRPPSPSPEDEGGSVS